MMYSAYKLNKQGENTQPWRSPFPIWNQSVVPHPVLTVTSWPTYRFLKRQVKWSGIPISFRIFHSSVVDVTGDRSKVWCYKEQYCIGTWNVRSTNQDELEVFKQEVARVNIDVLGLRELKWTGMGEFNSDDYYIYYCEQKSLRRNGVAIIVNKRVRNAILGCSLKNDRMISVRLQGKPFNITIQSKSMPQPVMLKKLKLNGSIKTYKTF